MRQLLEQIIASLDALNTVNTVSASNAPNASTTSNTSATPEMDQLAPLIALIDVIRPQRGEQFDSAAPKLRELTQLLLEQPESAAALRQYLLHQLSLRRQSSLYTDVGILSNDGFFSELKRRVVYRFLPPALDQRFLADCLDRLFPFNKDYLWLQSIAAQDWDAFLEALHPLAAADSADPLDPVAPTTSLQTPDQQKNLTEMLQAMQVLSYRISAIGIEPELIRIYSEVKAFESPFLMQNVELHRYVDGYLRHLGGDPTPPEDASHVLVMLEQCQQVVNKIRKNALRLGTSVAVTYRLVRLDQHLDRLHKLLSLVDVAASRQEKRHIGLNLTLELIEAHNRKYTVRELFADNINLLARNVTENASQTGEHYIAENRSEYNAMYRSAAGAGLVIGFMALLKILASYLHAPPLVEAFLYSMNYALGFMLIHLLHCTVATKQPAMTASRIAAGLHSSDGRNIDLESLTDMIVKVIRTQFIAVIGNLSVAFPVAWLLVSAYATVSGHHFVTPDKAAHLLQDIDPFGSLALFHAAIAGVCLFLAGLISGYYDNKALYTHMAQRVMRIRWLNRLLGSARTERVGNYLEHGLGALTGNFYFGILLGSIGTIGFLLGLPIDIRHITFSTANFAIALVALDYHVSWQVIVISSLGVLSIGLINLWVSFSLALLVAMRSRQVHFRHGQPLLKALGRRFLSRPLDFFIAPSDSQTADQAADRVATPPETDKHP